jgi:hypothetical protein
MSALTSARFYMVQVKRAEQSTQAFDLLLDSNPELPIRLRENAPVRQQAYQYVSQLVTDMGRYSLRLFMNVDKDQPLERDRDMSTRE